MLCGGSPARVRSSTRATASRPTSGVNVSSRHAGGRRVTQVVDGDAREQERELHGRRAAADHHHVPVGEVLGEPEVVRVQLAPAEHAAAGVGRPEGLLPGAGRVDRPRARHRTVSSGRPTLRERTSSARCRRRRARPARRARDAARGARTRPRTARSSTARRRPQARPGRRRPGASRAARARRARRPWSGRATGAATRHRPAGRRRARRTWPPPVPSRARRPRRARRAAGGTPRRALPVRHRSRPR